MATLQARIQSAISTAKQWEDDPALLAEIRASIPMKELVPELVVGLEDDWRDFINNNDKKGEEEVDHGNARSDVPKSKYHRQDDVNYEGDDLLLKRLTRYFKEDVMTWVNQPPCCNPDCKGNEDGKKMASTEMRGPMTEEEKVGRASRVEVYTCQLCQTQTTFPRHNNPRTLFQTRRGRCGEFANLFGTYCRALGYDTRYILDFTDHVWVEVYSVRTQRWIMADSCEGIIDEPSMYEKGWGKKLNYALGATVDSVVDVTKRYTRKFYTDEFQARRREFVMDEGTSERIIREANVLLRQQRVLPKGRVEELDKRMKMEAAFFGKVAASGVWDSEYNEGRLSGSLAWRAARKELGENGNRNSEEKKEGGDSNGNVKDNTTHSFLVESFYPSNRHENLAITVQSPCNVTSSAAIVVSGVQCAATLANGISVVVVDEASGCILQSRAFFNWTAAGKFLDTIPKGRILAICSNVAVTDETTIDESTRKILSTIGGLDMDSHATTKSSDTVSTNTSLFTLFVGQAGYHPKWAQCIQTSETTKSIQVSIELNLTSPPKVMLRSELNTVPAIVSTRFPEQRMPLKTQLEATSYQKRMAFKSYMDTVKLGEKSPVVGYVTKPGAPIYLIENDAFPFRRADGASIAPGGDKDSWTAYHYLPEQLVSDDDVIMDETTKASGNKCTEPKFDIPIAEDYWLGLLGNQLLVKNANNTSTLMDTVSAISNTRLVALYFSAQWCGPCRGFTPMLIEFYKYLKEEFAPTHGLEIIFVSSDRDDAQFQQYYQKMPFAAIPFSHRALAQRVKSMFAVQGIPSLVVIDSLSGRVVVSQDISRREVHQACQMGEQAIERLFNSWIEQVPEESRSILEILALSCEEAATNTSSSMEVDGGTNRSTSNSKAERYLVKQMQDGEKDGKPKPKEISSQEDFASRVKEIFAKLVAEGVEPNAAGAQAIQQATAEQKQPKQPKLDEGWVFGTCEENSIPAAINGVKIAAEQMCHLIADDKSKVRDVLTIAKKYVANVQKDPSNPKFRTFRLSNKVFDQITSTMGGINLLASLGFSFFHSDVDFVASIPLSVDLSLMSEVLEKTISVYSG